jgi:hypothetical protein
MHRPTPLRYAFSNLTLNSFALWRGIFPEKQGARTPFHGLHFIDGLRIPTVPKHYQQALVGRPFRTDIECVNIDAILGGITVVTMPLRLTDMDTKPAPYWNDQRLISAKIFAPGLFQP